MSTTSGARELKLLHGGFGGGARGDTRESRRGADQVGEVGPHRFITLQAPGIRVLVPA